MAARTPSRCWSTLTSLLVHPSREASISAILGAHHPSGVAGLHDEQHAEHRQQAAEGVKATPGLPQQQRGRQGREHRRRVGDDHRVREHQPVERVVVT